MGEDAASLLRHPIPWHDSTHHPKQLFNRFTRSQRATLQIPHWLALYWFSDRDRGLSEWMVMRHDGIARELSAQLSDSVFNHASHTLRDATQVVA